MPKNFELESEWFNYHPKGCFRDVCTYDHSKQCVYFNPSEKRPARCDKDKNFTDTLLKPYHKVGTPVCHRARFGNGTAHDEEASGAQELNGCAKNYGVIMHESLCLEAATCLGYCSLAEFRVSNANASLHDYYPNGCFIDKESGCVMFNDPSALGGKVPSHPGLYGGTEICEVQGRIPGLFGGTPPGALGGGPPGHPPPAAPASAIVSAAGDSAGDDKGE